MKKKIFSTLLLVAFALASTSMFVSCKDYDDDINANKDRIAALETTVKNLQASIATLESCCSTVQGEIATLKSGLAGKADQAALEELQGKYAELAADLVKLEDRVKALEDAKQVLEDAIAGKASQADLNELATKVAGIDSSLAGALADIATINTKIAAIDNLQSQIAVFEKYRQALLEYLGVTDDDAAIVKVKELVESLKAAIQQIGTFPADDLTQDEVNQIRNLLKAEDGQINNFITEANILQFLLNKQLTGLVAVDMNMIGGVEHIEVPAMYYQPVIANVGEGYLEEFHYMDPNTNEIFEADKFGDDASGNPNSPYLFDTGEMAPKASLGGVHSWKDFAAKYGEGGKDNSVLSFYNTLVSEFVRLKTAKHIAYGTFHALANPSSVDLSNTKFNFYTDTRIWGEEVESREGNDGFAVPLSEKIDGKNTVNNGGKISVNFTIPAWEAYVHQIARTADGNYVKNPFAPKDDKDAAEFASLLDSLNWVSLQAQVGTDDTPATVSSDFVVVTPSLIHVQALADNEPEAAILKCNNFDGWTGNNGLGGHLWKTARKAIKSPATHSVPFDAPFVDVMPFIETHFTNLGFFMTWLTYDKKMEADMFRQLGLQYNFKLIDYEDGVHETGETKHMTMKANYNSEADFGLASVQVTARSVDAQGNTKANEAATREAIDREPLMRVELLAPAADHHGNRKWNAAQNTYVECTDGDYNVIEIGYIKFIITDHLEPTFVNIEMPDDYYMNCDDSQEITWAQVEALILAKIGDKGYTKSQFEGEYGIIDDNGNLKDLNTTGFGEINARQWYFESDTNDFTTDVNPKDGNPDNVKPGAYYDAHSKGGDMGTIAYCEFDKAKKQTNVLRWTIAASTKVRPDGSAYPIDKKREDVMIYITGTDNVEDAREVLIANEGKGLEHHDLITTVKFVKKGVDPKTANMTAIYVNIIVPGNHIHFAYADADRKDLSHWYDLNSTNHAGQGGENAYEVHMNVPTEDDLLNPSGNRKDKDGNTALPKSRLDESEYWRNIFENYYADDNHKYPNGEAMPHVFTVYHADKFDKFAYEDGFYLNTPSFRFVLPKNGVNATNVNVVDGTWQVYGYSSKHIGLEIKGKPAHHSVEVYTLHISDDGKKILDQHGCVIASIYLNKTSNYEIIELGYNPDEYAKCPNVDCEECGSVRCKCAQDILNYAGRYSDSGENLKDSWMDEGKTFTAYAEIIGDPADCYPILIGHRYINFRFERPISAWPVYKLVKDGINVEKSNNELYSYELVNIADWRDYVIMNTTNKVTSSYTLSYQEYDGETDYSKAGLTSKKWPENFSGYSPYFWLGVEEIYADVDNILTDHGRTREEVEANHALIFGNSDGNAYVKVAGKDVYNQEALRGWIANGKLKYDLISDVPGFKSSFDYEGARMLQLSGQWKMTFNKFAFFNNKDNVQLFHYFIPVYVRYSYGETHAGNYLEWTYDHNKTVTPEKRDFAKPATFKVWVVVTCLNTINN